MKKRNLRNKLINFSITMVSCLLIYVGFLIYFNSYRKGLIGYGKMASIQKYMKGYAPLAPEDLIQLGSAHYLKRCPSSSYLYFPKEKAPGKFRIGLFGCSYTFGYEAPTGYDMATLLQMKYDSAGRTDVEVINFGVTGYGMGRSFYLWDKLGREYDLDLCIFNAYNFHFPRENTFRRIPEVYGPIHGRYIMEDGKLKYIPVLGSSIEEAASIYNALFPPFPYVRYEMKDPHAITSILGKGRKLMRNPFYFNPNPGREWNELYGAFFDSVANSSPRLLVMINQDKLRKIRSHMKNQDFSIFLAKGSDIREKGEFLYEAINSHPSSLGYQFMGEELFAYLEGDTAFTFPVIQFSDRRDSGAFPLYTPASLEELSELYVGIDTMRISEFCEKKSGFKHEKKDDFSWANTSAISLLGLHNFRKWACIPLDKKYHGRVVCKISFMLGDVKREVRVKELNFDAGFWKNAGNWESDYFSDKVKIRFRMDSNGPLLDFFTKEKVRDVQIMLDDSPILEGSASPGQMGNGQRFDLLPRFGKWLYARASHDQNANVHAMPASGTIDIRGTTHSGKAFCIPVFDYQKQYTQPSSIGN